MRILIKKETNKKLPLSEKKIKEIILFLFKELKYNIEDKELSIVLGDDKLIKELNTKYRKEKRSTDVLIFNLENAYSPLLGELIISIDKVYKQAKEYKISIKLELINLLTHGILHLMGYNHQDYNQNQSMYKLQKELVNKLIRCLV